MKMLHKEKKRTIIYCEEVLRKAEKEAELESIKFMEQFKSIKKHQFRDINRLKPQDAELDTYEDNLMKEIDQLEDDLMNVEMKLQDSL